jgi:membrane protein DedA with SNARE-associated domain
MFLAIVASGHVVPLPELLTLILLGYVAAIGNVHMIGLMVVAVFAILVVDMVIYLISLSGSKLAIRLEKSVKIDWIERYRTAEERKLFLLVFVSHFVPGWRMANPIIAGVTNMPWRKFTLYTFISAVVYAPLAILAGFFYHKDILPLIATVASVQQILFFILIISLVIILGVFFENSNRSYNTSHAKK